MATVIWITGRPGSGKTTLLHALLDLRPELSAFDGDEIRDLLYPALGYDETARWTQIKTLALLARTNAKHGANVVIACVSPLNVYRTYARMMTEQWGHRFIEVYLYGRKSKMWEGSTFELPRHPDAEFDTTASSALYIAADITGRYLQQPSRQLFIGRWQPFHKGHKKIILEALRDGPVAIGVRKTCIGIRDPDDAHSRCKRIRAWASSRDVEVFICPDINSIHIGRDVGYAIIQHDAVPGVSGTELRKKDE